ncbi:MAG TPA: DUF2339 domain-containing protein [Caldimonas sp.]|nr:DUF2339 domain-containing protein [Caldimonas sp.]
MGILAAIAGGILGAWIGDGQGAAFGCCIGWLAWRSWRQERRIDVLQKRLGGASGEATAADSPPAIPEPAPMASPDLGAHDAWSWHDPPAGGRADAASEPKAEPVRVTVGPPARSSAFRTFLASVRDSLFGGNAIVKAGVGILFIGLAFLARFASEHVHVPVEFRLATIAGVALVLLALGWRLRLRRPGYAQVLQGGAIAVLYLTLFVAFRTFAVLPVGATFGLMVLVSALAAALAVLQDARALAVVGALGGFATPLLVSTGSGNHVALFTYYLVLDAGIALVAWHRTWRSLNLVGFLGTFGVATAWGVLRYVPAHYASSQAFLIAFFLLFNAILLMPARRRAIEPSSTAPLARLDAWVQGALLFGLPTITFVLQAGLVRDVEHGAALSALAMAAFYVAMAAALRARPQAAAAFEGSLAVGTVFATLVIPFALDARSTAGAWSLEAAGLVWIGLRQGRLRPRAFGYALFVLSGLAMLNAQERLSAPAGWANGVLFNALMCAAASLVAAHTIARHAASLQSSERIAEPLLVGWAVLWSIGAAAFEIDAFVPASLQLAAWVSSLSALALMLGAVAWRLDWRTAAWPALAHAPLLAWCVLIWADTLARPSAAGGAWAWPFAIAVHMALLRFVAPRWPSAGAAIVHALGVIVLAGLGALEGRAITAAWGDDASAWSWLGWLVVPAALLLALPRPALAARWPMTAAPTAYRHGAAAALAAGLWVWTLVANVASDGGAQPLPHVPILNPLDLGIGLALVAIVLWRRDVPDAPPRRGPWIPALLAVAVFVWLNAVLVRGFHHYAGVPYRVDAWMASLAVQTGLTLLWTALALALMWVAARRDMRRVWLAGAALLGVVVVKLLAIDLSGSGTVARIVSFIGVGALMLVIGYVAPLPGHSPKEASRATT